jgi:hypothetical protein
VAATVIGKFVGDDMPPEDLREMCEEAYATFAHAAVAPLKQLGPNRFLLELFHGPTLAFKDVAMQLLGRLYDYVLERQSRKMTIICATSGDTGGAAVEAFRGRKNARIVALFPEGRISEVQRRFMTTATDDNVACVSIQGSFDDCQAIVKQAFQDDQFRHAVDLSGVNSINWARIAAQSVYYFTAAVALGAPSPQGGLRGADGQFRRRLRRLRGHQDGPADRPDRGRHQFQRHPGPGLRGRPLRARRGRRHPEPGHGHPGRLQLRAPVFRGRRAATASRPAAPSGPSTTRACSTSRPAPTPRCASCSRARRSARPTPPRPCCRP